MGATLETGKPQRAGSRGVEVGMGAGQGELSRREQAKKVPRPFFEGHDDDRQTKEGEGRAAGDEGVDGYVEV